MSHLAEVTDLVIHARERLEELFGPHDPRRAHEHHSPEEVAPLLGSWKPRFIHDPVSKQLVAEVIKAIGCLGAASLRRPQATDRVSHRASDYRGRLRIPIGTPGTPPPKQQINWWLPIYEITPDNTMMFDLEYFGRPIVNTSREFDYYAINEARRHTATQVKRELQARPEAEGHQPANTVHQSSGSPAAVMLFSGAHLHASVPNTTAETRYSIDFRTVDSDDVEADVGAELVDSDCPGTALATSSA